MYVCRREEEGNSSHSPLPNPGNTGWAGWPGHLLKTSRLDDDDEMIPLWQLRLDDDHQYLVVTMYVRGKLLPRKETGLDC
jgi:hypothetical protein